MNKQAQKVIFFRKLSKPSHLKIVFNSAPVVCADLHKHLGMYLHNALNFNLHIKEKNAKAMKGIGITHKLSINFLLYSLITIYKSFVRPRYGDKIYDQPNNESFTQKMQKFNT